MFSKDLLTLDNSVTAIWYFRCHSSIFTSLLAAVINMKGKTLTINFHKKVRLHKVDSDLLA